MSNIETLHQELASSMPLKRASHVLSHRLSQIPGYCEWQKTYHVHHYLFDSSYEEQQSFVARDSGKVKEQFEEIKKRPLQIQALLDILANENQKRVSYRDYYLLPSHYLIHSQASLGCIVFQANTVTVCTTSDRTERALIAKFITSSACATLDMKLTNHHFHTIDSAGIVRPTAFIYGKSAFIDNIRTTNAAIVLLPAFLSADPAAIQIEEEHNKARIDTTKINATVEKLHELANQKKTYAMSTTFITLKSHKNEVCSQYREICK